MELNLRLAPFGSPIGSVLAYLYGEYSRPLDLRSAATACVLRLVSHQKKQNLRETYDDSRINYANGYNTR